ncbi:MAG: hypothetical protein SFY68_13455 [Candidatus Sumerlaeia bacterium]|nr:hypothetical protein [Candidatus Sumerlaeia bacterium]
MFGKITNRYAFNTTLLCSLLVYHHLSAFTPGKDGDRTISTAVTNLNPSTTMSANAVAGATQIRQTATSNTLGLTVGDLILVYQPQGATINATNTFNYGEPTITGAGKYEFLRVTTVPVFNGPGGSQRFIGVSNASTPCGGLTNSYTTADGTVLILRVPQYDDLTLATGGSITAPAWSGTAGGVVAVHVNGILSMAADTTISATARGFRGGAFENSAAPNGQTDFLTTTADNGARKGEGIAGLPSATQRGRGASANGGGGGASHNAGGGGGSNGNNGNSWTIGSPATAGGQGVMNSTYAAIWALDPSFALNSNALTNSSGGGRGGYTWSNVVADPAVTGPGNNLWGNENGPTNYFGDARRQVGGLGGRPLTNSPTGRLFMGGGGGAGHGNNSTGGSGGAGGGLIIILANQITGTGSIQSNGANGGNAGAINPNDAPGGAGAGGTILIRANNIASTISVQANGGNGGNQVWDNTLLTDPEVEGPGGGGGGGYIALSGGAPTRTANGGSAGTTNKTFMSAFPVNGATNGATGQATEPLTQMNICGGSINGRVFLDINGNASLDPGEPGIAGVPVTITPVAGAAFTLTTLANGTYSALVPASSNVSTTAVVDGNSPNIPSGAVLTTAGVGGTLSQGAVVTEQTAANTINIGYQTSPQFVLLESFTAELNEADGLVHITWVTAAEIGTAGFDLLLQHKDGTLENVIPSFVEPKGNEISGATYTVIDPRPFVSGEVRQYLLKETEFSGKELFYGPTYYPAGAALSSTSASDWQSY